VIWIRRVLLTICRGGEGPQTFEMTPSFQPRPLRLLIRHEVVGGVVLFIVSVDLHSAAVGIDQDPIRPEQRCPSGRLMRIRSSRLRGGRENWWQFTAEESQLPLVKL
jgi:hypothetical protein